MKLFVARWPDGTAWIVRARSLPDVADILDRAADPGPCDVAEYDGPFALQIRPAPTTKDASYVVFEDAEADDVTIEMHEHLLKVAYPTLADVVDNERDEDGLIDEERWRAAVAGELARKVEPSPEWAAGVKKWWEAFSGHKAEHSAALRRMQGVSIPGEPKIESPAQAALFDAAQKRIMNATMGFLSGKAKPAKKKAAKQPRKPTPKKPKK